MVDFTSRPLEPPPPEVAPVPVEWGGGGVWISKPVWTFQRRDKTIGCARIRTPICPARNLASIMVMVYFVSAHSPVCRTALSLVSAAGYSTSLRLYDKNCLVACKLV